MVEYTQNHTVVQPLLDLEDIYNLKLMVVCLMHVSGCNSTKQPTQCPDNKRDNQIYRYMNKLLMTLFAKYN